MSTGFIWLSTETFSEHLCTVQSDAVNPWYSNSYTERFTWNLTVNIFLFYVYLLVTTDNILLNLANTLLFLCDQVTDILPRQNNGLVLSV